MANEKEVKKSEVVKKIDSNSQVRNDSTTIGRVVNDSAINENRSRDISKMQAPDKWPDPIKKKGS